MKVTILTEGGSQIGLGHVVRSITLAKKLKAEIRLLSGPLSHDFGFPLDPVAEGELGTPDTDLVIRDLCTGYPTRTSAFTIDVVDESRERSGEADLTLAAFGMSQPSKGIYAGLDFVILRSEFESVPEPQRHGIAICLGGTDPTSSSERIAESLESIAPISRPRFGDSISELLSECEIAITSAGMTMLEAAACGAPTLVVSHNQREHARMIELIDQGYGSLASSPLSQHVGHFRYLGSATSIDRGGVRTAVQNLLTSPTLRDLMSAFGRHNVDGHGARRVAKIITETFQSRAHGNETQEHAQLWI